MPRYGTLLPALLVAALAACSEEEPPVDDTAARDAARDSAVITDSIYTPQQDQAELPSDRIYYRLTDYPWYAEGRPLLHEGREYQPGGTPVNASLDEMTPAGEYEGVEYYLRSGESAEALYVPVFEGYWQVFRPDGGQ